MFCLLHRYGLVTALLIGFTRVCVAAEYTYQGASFSLLQGPQFSLTDSTSGTLSINDPPWPGTCTGLGSEAGQCDITHWSPTASGSPPLSLDLTDIDPSSSLLPRWTLSFDAAGQITEWILMISDGPGGGASTSYMAVESGPPNHIVLGNAQRGDSNGGVSHGGSLYVSGHLFEITNPWTLVGNSTTSTEHEWNGDRGGDWNTVFNWTAGLPDGNDQTAIFGDKITTTRTVFTDQAVTIKAAQFISAQSYVIAGGGSVNLEAGTPPAEVLVLFGDHQFQAVVNLNSDTNVTIAPDTSLAFNNVLDLGGNTLTKIGGGTLSINNILSTGSGGTIDCQGGNCAGSGTVGGNLSNNSLVSPGNSPGILSVDGNYTQTAGGTLEIELASNGGVAGADHDRLAVTLAASLDGTLDLQLDGGYTPTIGDSFAGIVTAGALSGQFATTSNVVIDGRRGVAVTYTGTDVDAQIGLRGNTDIATGDIDVDTSDLTTSIINFTSAGGAGKTWADGDTDGDGDVDTSDLTTSIINFTSALSSGASAVPEPTSLLLLSLGVLLLAGRIPASRAALARGR